MEIVAHVCTCSVYCKLNFNFLTTATCMLLSGPTQPGQVKFSVQQKIANVSLVYPPVRGPSLIVTICDNLAEPTSSYCTCR